MFKLSAAKLAHLYFVKFTLIVLSIFSLSSCSVPGKLDSDNYGRNDNVYAVDFNPKDLNNITLYLMNEGDWADMGKIKNNPAAKFQITLEGDFLIVQANDESMDVPTYQPWLNYARIELGYTEEVEYDVFNILEEG